MIRKPLCYNSMVAGKSEWGCTHFLFIAVNRLRAASMSFRVIKRFEINIYLRTVSLLFFFYNNLHFIYFNVTYSKFKYFFISCTNILIFGKRCFEARWYPWYLTPLGFRSGYPIIPRIMVIHVRLSNVIVLYYNLIQINLVIFSSNL